MKNSYFRAGLVVSLALGVLVLVGCSTPGARIRKNQAVFDRLPEEIREQVRRGQVEVGFPQDAAFLAMGKPERQYLRKSDSGTTLIWSYVAYENYPQSQQITGNFRVRDKFGVTHNVRDSVWVDVQHTREYEHTRVEIVNGKIAAVESVSR